VRFPQQADDDDALLACTECLRSGRVAMTKDTELGMVRWQDARDGSTHGLPGFSSAEWETPPPDEEGWVRVRVASAVLDELVRTPGYVTIQGERWLFCCKAPMVYLGARSCERFSAEADDADGRALFDRIVEGIVPGSWEDELHDETGVYVFAC
jgi:uncharacterized protein CbrC (UPF0167 family)